MSTPVGANGENFAYPTDQEVGYASQATGWAQAVTAALDAIGRGRSVSVNPKAVVDMVSTSKGLLIPRMTTVQISAISSPPESLLVYDTTQRVFKYYRNSAWVSVGSFVEGNFDVNGDLDVSGAGVFGSALSALSLAITNAITAASATLTGAFQALTGNFTDATDATNADTAPLKTLGGMAVKKKLFVGTDLDVGGILSVTGNTNVTGQLNSNGTFNLLPAGTIIIVSSLVVPSGFLPCNGAQNISRTTQSRLFAAMPSTTSTITVTVANTINWTAHGLSTGHSIQFTTTGTLPTGLTANTIYFVRVLTANTFALYGTLSQSMNVSVTTGQVTFTVTGSGTHTGLVYYYGNGIDNTNTTFGIPDFRGVVPRGIGTTNGYIEPATVNLGEKTDDQFQNHAHTQYGFSAAYGSGTPYYANTSQGGSTDPTTGAIQFSTFGAPRIGNETRAKSLGVYYLIKT